MRYNQTIYIVVIENLDIDMRMFNINSIEIHNKTKIGKWFICFTRELKRTHHLIIYILGNRLIKTGK